jgi:3-deoxy-D-arabino-heptulosonate 7-phosphate (DAHP) synthase
MAQEVNDNSAKKKASEDRREFLRRAGKASLGVPATALLISVTDKSAKAWGDGYGHTYDMDKIKEWFESHYGD